MAQSSNLQDLFKPGAADNFFAIKSLDSFDPALTRSFSRRNALWLAEFSRLIYRQQADEINVPPGSRTRNEILASTGWRETDFIHKRSTQAAFLVNDVLGAVCLVFRGTLSNADLVSDAQILAVPWQGKGFVHVGFKDALEAVWSEVEARLRTIQQPVFFAGHSLGGALATLAAARVLQNSTLRSPASVYTFGSPRVGDDAFGKTFGDLFHCRMVNDRDVVTTIPPAFSLPLFPVYRHNGEMHRLLPDGVMEIFPNGFDVHSTRNPLAGVVDFSENVHRLFQTGHRTGAIPLNLQDHAPINYVSRLEEIR